MSSRQSFRLRLRREMRSILSAYQQLFRAIKTPDKSSELHDDAELQMQGLQINLVTNSIIESVERLLQLCNELEEICIIQDAQTLNPALRKRKEDLCSTIKELHSQLSEPFNQVEETIDELADHIRQTS
eukprot:gene2195-5207_t